MAKLARMLIHFMDGTKVAFTYPKQADDPAITAMNVRKAHETIRL